MQGFFWGAMCPTKNQGCSDWGKGTDAGTSSLCHSPQSKATPQAPLRNHCTLQKFLKTSAHGRSANIFILVSKIPHNMKLTSLSGFMSSGPLLSLPCPLMTLHPPPYPQSWDLLILFPQTGIALPISSLKPTCPLCNHNRHFSLFTSLGEDREIEAR